MIRPVKSTPATFDDLPTEIRRKIMMHRASRKGFAAAVKKAPSWVHKLQTAKKEELIDFCQHQKSHGCTGFSHYTKYWLRFRLVKNELDLYFEYLRNCNQVWQDATFKLKPVILLFTKYWHWYHKIILEPNMLTSLYFSNLRG